MIEEIFRGDLGAVIIMAIGLITATMSVYVGWKWRGKYIPVSWRSFISMGLGSIGISALYVHIIYSHDLSIAIPLSRVLWFFVLLLTLLMAVGVLVTGDEQDG